MKVDIEKLPGDNVKLKVELDSDEFAQYYEDELENILASVEMKGFRKGKVPRSVYLRRFGDAKVLQQAIDKALNDSYFEAIQKHELKVIAEPKIDIDFERYAEEKVFSYTAEVPVYPEVELGDYYGLEVEKLSTKVKDEDVDKFIAQVQKDKSDLELVEEGTLEEGNVAVFDFEGFVDGEAFQGGKAENYQLEIGSGAFIPGFEEQMIGMKSGEEGTIKVTFPEDYQAENLQGKEAEFKIVLHEIKKRVLPELSDDFVKSLNNSEFSTVAEYREYITNKLISEKKEAAEKKFEYDVVKMACDNAKVEVPEVMVQAKIENIIQQEEERAKSYNLNFEQFLTYQGLTLEKYREMISEPAAFEVLKELVLNKIIETENIELNNDDYEEGYLHIAETYNVKLEEAKEQFPKNEISYYFLLRKTVELIKEKSIIKE